MNRQTTSKFDELLEPKAVAEFGDCSADELCVISSAVSLKRIADLLEILTTAPEELLHKIAQYPTNNYGEGFSEAIQNSIARGLQGINTGSLNR